MNDTTEITADYLPIVHMNGTGKKDLFEGCKSDDAADKLHKALTRDVTFHQRDYYVIPGQWERALKERQDIMGKFDDIRDYIEKHVRGVAGGY